MDDFVTREEFNNTMIGIRKEVSDVREAVAAFRVTAENINAAVAQATKLFYGEKQDGILFVVKELVNNMGMLKWFTGTVATLLLGAGIARLMGTL